MEGILEKWTNYLNGWTPRYFVLKNNLLMYYEEKGKPRKGIMYIPICTLTEQDDLSFDIETGTNKFFLKCENVEQKDKWMRAIKIAKLQSNSNTSNSNNNNDTIIKSRAINKNLNNNNDNDSAINELFLELLNNNEVLNETNYSEIKAKNASILNSIKGLINIDEKEQKIENQDNLNNNLDIINRKDTEVYYDLDDYTKKIHEKNNILKFAESLTNFSIKKLKDDDMGAFYDSAYVGDNLRKELPFKRTKANFSVWSILKDSVGKDLNKISMPVYFNEPLSMCQRVCENFQYAELLDKAAKSNDSILRLAYTGAFAMSAYAINSKRILKFFNPILGETFEYIDNDKKFKYFSEQVSHHPAITAVFVQGDGYTFTSNTNAKSEFKLLKNTLEFHLSSRTYLNFNNGNRNTMISYSKPITAARNLIGSVYIDCYGKFDVKNHDTDERIYFEIYEASNDKQGIVKATVYDGDGGKVGLIEGNYLQSLTFNDMRSGEKILLWEKDNSNCSNDENKYFFTEFMCNLNNLNEDLKKKLPKTDSRFRPDQRALENQNLELANQEKLRLEEIQRKARKIREEKKQVYRPKFFAETYDDITGELVYSFERDYWKDRAANNFNDLPDLF